MMQPELFQRSLDINPVADATEPRLWVRRLVIWEEPDKEPLRDITLRPGMNIVWTPDDQGIGHGGGKTLFCRLLRYCLGESTFAPEEQRDSITSAFLNASVGAEVMLDGVCWAILRPLGSRRRHFAIPEGRLEDLIKGDVAPTGMEPFLEAVEQHLITPAVAELVPGRNQKYLAWQVVLAWLTRDQECRFDHVLDWRSTQSDSDSPARGLNQTEKLEALRAFLKAMNPKEQLLRQKISSCDEERNRLEQDIGHRRWDVRRLRESLLQKLEIADDELTQGSIGIALFRDVAQQRLNKASGASSDEVKGLGQAWESYESARNAMVELEKRAERLQWEIDSIPKVIARIEGEYPSRIYALDEADSFPCPICEVPVDRVLADKCGLSNKLPDIEACKNRLQINREDYQRESERLEAAKRNLEQLRPELALAKQKRNSAEAHYKKLDEARFSTDQFLYEARRVVDEVERLEQLMYQEQRASETTQKVEETLDGLKREMSKSIDQQASAFSGLNEKFDALIRLLLENNARGEVRLTGKGLKLRVQMGGNRSTSAIDSLKVVAFDLAVMCLSMEGKTHIPAFLVHDSPREADLGLPLYDRLFELVLTLEKLSAQPLFQYIITTTTRPPEALAKQPWLALTLSGATAEGRLLKRDL